MEAPPSPAVPPELDAMEAKLADLTKRYEELRNLRETDKEEFLKQGGITQLGLLGRQIDKLQEDVLVEQSKIIVDGLNQISPYILIQGIPGPSLGVRKVLGDFETQDAIKEVLVLMAFVDIIRAKAEVLAEPEKAEMLQFIKNVETSLRTAEKAATPRIRKVLEERRKSLRLGEDLTTTLPRMTALLRKELSEEKPREKFGTALEPEEGIETPKDLFNQFGEPTVPFRKFLLKVHSTRPETAKAIVNRIRDLEQTPGMNLERMSKEVKDFMREVGVWWV